MTTPILDALQWLDEEQQKPDRWVRPDSGVLRFALTLPELNRIRAVLSAALASASAGQEKRDPVCEHGTALDVHCCNCHGGFLFDADSCVCRFEEKKPMQSEIPRRADMQRWCAAEKAIYEACLAVEQMPADVRLTDAVVALGKARDHVADYVDGVAPPRAQETAPGVLDYMAVMGMRAPETPRTCETCKHGAKGWIAEDELRVRCGLFVRQNSELPFNKPDFGCTLHEPAPPPPSESR